MLLSNVKGKDQISLFQLHDILDFILVLNEHYDKQFKLKKYIKKV